MFKRTQLLSLFVALMSLACADGGEALSSTQNAAPTDGLCKRVVPELSDARVMYEGESLTTCKTGRCFLGGATGYMLVNGVRDDAIDLTVFREDDEAWRTQAFAIAPEHHPVRMFSPKLTLMVNGEEQWFGRTPTEEIVLGDIEPLWPMESVSGFALSGSGGVLALIRASSPPPDHTIYWSRWVELIRVPQARQKVHDGDVWSFIVPKNGRYTVQVDGEAVTFDDPGHPVGLIVHGKLLFVVDEAARNVSVMDATGQRQTVNICGEQYITTPHGIVRYDPLTREVTRHTPSGEGELLLSLSGANNALDDDDASRRHRLDVNAVAGGFVIIERRQYDDCHFTDQMFRYYVDTGDFVALTEPTRDALYGPQMIRHKLAYVRAQRSVRFLGQ